MEHLYTFCPITFEVIFQKILEENKEYFDLDEAGNIYVYLGSLEKFFKAKKIEYIIIDRNLQLFDANMSEYDKKWSR